MEYTSPENKSEQHVEICLEGSGNVQEQGDLTRGDEPTAFTINFDGDHPTSGSSIREE